jgi:hypothetical protein
LSNVYRTHAQLRLVIIFVVAVTNLMFATQAQSVELSPIVTVQTRPRPELDPFGIRMGGFLVFPKLILGLQNDGNIFATNTGTVSDRITLFQPQVDIKSNWSKHSLGFRAEYNGARYSQNSGEDYDDHSAELYGRLDISSTNSLGANLQFAKLHEARTSPDDINGITPTIYSQNTASLTYSYDSNRMSLLLNGSFLSLNFDPTQTSTGYVNNDDRNRAQSLGEMRLGYIVTPGYQVYFQGHSNSRVYDQSTDRYGYKRNSHGYDVAIGAALISGVTNARVYFGHLAQSYDDNRFKKVSEPIFGGELTWNPSGLTTITGRITRQIDETTFENASGIRVTQYDAAIDHELRRFLILHAGISKRQEDYQGINRQDDVTALTVSAKYMINRHFYVALLYDHERRESDPFLDGIYNYRINKYMLNISLQV